MARVPWLRDLREGWRQDNDVELVAQNSGAVGNSICLNISANILASATSIFGCPGFLRGLLPQDKALDFAAWRFGESLRELDLARIGVGGEALLDEEADLLGARRARPMPLPQRAQGPHPRAPHGLRAAKSRPHP